LPWRSPLSFLQPSPGAEDAAVAAVASEEVAAAVASEAAAAEVSLVVLR
jgi:hypothetical protein